MELQIGAKIVANVGYEKHEYIVHRFPLDVTLDNRNIL